MSDTELAQLARKVGINIDWVDAFGNHQKATPDCQRALLEELGFPAWSPQQIAESTARAAQPLDICAAPLITHEQGRALHLHGRFAPGTSFQVVLESGQICDGRVDEHGALPAIGECGYHQLHIGALRLVLAIAPHHCPGVDQLLDQRHSRIWGITAQVYSLRRHGDGGAGDAAALETLARSAASKGADVLALSPLHAINTSDIHNFSPYSPSSRMFFNVLHAAPDLVLGEQAMARAVTQCEARAELDRLEALDLIDWPAVAQLRLRLLRQLHENFSRAEHPLRRDFEQYSQQGGEALTQHCRFEALQNSMISKQESADWRNWPQAYQDPHSTAVEQFAAEHAHEIDFHSFAQWLTVRSLERVQKTARSAGMKIGLLADLAVGAIGSGSQTWTRQQEFLSTTSVGAPPDVLNSSGQNWGISAFSPFGLRAQGFRAFIEMLRANLANANGLRIDHVMGLQRLWLIPKNASADQGAYLNYPLEDQLRLLALEAWRHKALIIGEDLGTVPEGLHKALASHHILGTRVLLFEHHKGQFRAPEEWPHDALATTTTHDLPTISGWLHGRDIDWRYKANHRSENQTGQDRSCREQEKAGLLRALEQSVHLAADGSDALDASIEFIGSTPAPLALLPLEDAMGSDEQPNLPGHGNDHPNWRRRWPMDVQEMLNYPQVDKRLRRLADARSSVRTDARTDTRTDTRTDARTIGRSADTTAGQAAGQAADKTVATDAERGEQGTRPS